MKSELLSNLIITKVHSASTLFSPQNKKAKRKNRSRWAVIVKYEGETLYTANGKRFLSDANHLVILPKGCTYEWECTKAGHFSTVEFESEGTFCEPLVFKFKNPEKILKIVWEMEHKRTVKQAMTEMECIRDVYSILLILAGAESDPYFPTEKQKKISLVLDYISQNYHKSITNDALAKLAGMSTVYFRKLFTELMGTSPIAYARQLRIEKAKEMLKSDYGTLTDLAQLLGYASLYDFSRDFKKHTGISPSKY
ncbi:MAG: helix-turn-helix transcriptional regulator [Ruminococcaceae bacterium]|nr:helix-turn-helix transcriptional regulator [Oscillospiraceae bacterium]